MATRKKPRSKRSTKTPKTESVPNKPANKKTTETRLAHLRATISGPTNAESAASAGDPLAIKFDAIQKLAADMPYNINKPFEHGDLLWSLPRGKQPLPKTRRLAEAR